MEKFLVITHQFTIPVSADSISDVPRQYFKDRPLGFDMKIIGIIRYDQFQFVLESLQNRLKN